MRHDRAIYRGAFNGTPVFLLCQVDDFALAAPGEATAKAIFDEIGSLLQLPSESKPPFSYLGPLDDFNGIDVDQFNDRIVIHCTSYIQRLLRTHGWENSSVKESKSTRHINCSPLLPGSLSELYASVGPPENTPEHQTLVDEFEFSYCTLLGELLYAYVTCRPDIGYVITLSKFANCPSAFHFKCLHSVAKYLRCTISWGIHFHRDGRIDSFLPCTVPAIPIDSSLPQFPALQPGFQLTGFIDAAHANDLRKRRSTTGYAFIMAGGCVSYRCKTQPLVATSSTEAEFYAAVTAAKHARYLRAILHDLKFAQAVPTPLYCNNESAINMVNAKIPTDRSRHIAIQFFAIQQWKEHGDIVLRHIPGVINPSDDLTKPLGWIVHARHCHRLMGHFFDYDSSHPP